MTIRVSAGRRMGHACDAWPVKLILVEGVPGAGKSTIAQRATAEMRTAGLAVRWLYEEELGHPVYVFDDDAAARLVVEHLRQRRFEGQISKAVQRWAEFAASLSASISAECPGGSSSRRTVSLSRVPCCSWLRLPAGPAGGAGS